MTLPKLCRATLTPLAFHEGSSVYGTPSGVAPPAGWIDKGEMFVLLSWEATLPTQTDSRRWLKILHPLRGPLWISSAYSFGWATVG